MRTAGFWVILIAIGGVSCEKNPGYVAVEIPPHFPAPALQIVGNEAEFELGKRLFYDTLLSLDNSISCASCHAQLHSFADHNHAFSLGINKQFGRRNAPPLFNLAWHPHFMWDGGVNHLDFASLPAIESPIEMGETLSNVLQKLANQPIYPSLFLAAYGTAEINSQRFLKALAHFSAAIVSADSPYDAFKKGKKDLSIAELRGYSLFQQHCQSCHREPLFSTFGFASHGLPENPFDLGRYEITGNPSDKGLFKIPTLRNLEFTYPYMHDGSIPTLMGVLNQLETGLQITLNSEEKSDLIAFLQTLNDAGITYNPTFAAPQ
jgi:cytochrome c peroxidase